MRYEPEPTHTPKLNAQERDYIAYYVEDQTPELAERMRNPHPALGLTLAEVQQLLRVLTQDADRIYTTYARVITALRISQEALRGAQREVRAREEIHEVGLAAYLAGAPTSSQPHGDIADNRARDAESRLNAHSDEPAVLEEYASGYGIR